MKIHGGLDYSLIGENIVAVTIGTKLNNKGRTLSTATYEASGRTMALLWKSSPEHYKNIILQKYKYSALAVSYDSITQRLVAVQVFGLSNTPPSLSKQPDYSDQLLNASKQELPYNLKKYRFNKRNRNATLGFLELGMQQGYLTGKYKDAKKIFKGAKSGISQEFIPISDYDSNSKNFSMVPNRRNGLYELNGTLSKLVYRKELLKYSRLSTNREYFINKKWIKIKKPTKEFKYPLSSIPGNEYNLFFIKNKRLVTLRTYMMVPSCFFDTPFPKLGFISEFTNYDQLTKYRKEITYDTLSINVFYPVGETEIDSIRRIEVLKNLNRIKGNIIDIQTSAYASIEGYSPLNQKLATERMSAFLSLAAPWLNKVDFDYQLITGEHWDLFYQQIKGTQLAYLGQMSKDGVRKYINEHRKDSAIMKLLNEQRLMEFRLICTQDTLVLIISKQSPAELYDSLLTLLYYQEKPKTKFVRTVERAQLSYYHYLAQSDTILPDSVIPFPELEKHPEFEYHHLVFQYLVLKNLTDDEFYIMLHEIGYSRYFPRRLKDKLIYNNLLLIYNSFVNKNSNQLVDDVSCTRMRLRDFYFKNFASITCNFTKKNEDFFTLSELPRFTRLQKKIYQDTYTNELSKFYYLYTIISLRNTIPLNPEIYRYLRGFKRYFHPFDKNLTNEERLKYAYFYCIIEKYKVAKKLIEPIATMKDPHIESLKLYITLKYEDFEELHDFANYLISQFPRLGENDWCDLWKNPNYLNALLLEDIKLKNFYNCNCNK